jgi:multidrug efflux pump subunit AcrB
MIVSSRIRLLAVVAILAGYPRPALPADWLELLGLSSASGTTVVVVEANYPGTNAELVADTIAAPIEQQVNGVENMRYMCSRCVSRGRYALTIVFDKKADPDMSQVLVQNRVSLALPMLPDLVQSGGISVRREWPRPLAIVILRSPDGSRELRSLNGEALANVRDELLRLPGVSQIRCLGQSDCSLRIHLKPKQMADQKLTVSDVLAAIKGHDAKPSAGPIGQPPAILDASGAYATTLGRLANIEQFERIALRTDAGGRVAMLKDVARFDSGLDLGRVATLGGKPVVALAVYLLPGARPQKVVAGVRARLAEIRPRLPKGMAIDADFDFSTSIGAANFPGAEDYVLIDFNRSGGESSDQFRKIAVRCQTLLGTAAGVREVLTLPVSPFVAADGPPCLVVRLAPAEKGPITREKVVAGIRSRLAEMKEARPRVHELPGPGDPAGAGYPIDMAIYGPDADKLSELTVRLAGRLREGGKLTDVWADSERKPGPQLYVDVDRSKALGRGASMNAIFETLAVLGGSDDANALGRSWQATIDVGDKPPTVVGTLLIRSRSGDLVQLSALAALRMVEVPTVVDRFNLYPMVEVSSSPAAGVSRADARAFCETLFARTRKELGLNDRYRLSWLGQ